MSRNSRALAYLIIGMLSVALIVVLSMVNRRASFSPATEPEYVLMLVRAREHQPFVHPYEFKSLDDFMVLKQQFSRRDISRPVSDPPPDRESIEYGCGMLTIVIGGDRSLNLNSSAMGTLDDTTALESKISEVFRQRVEQRYYRRGFETRSDLRADERILRTVLVLPSESARYGDVVRLLELLKKLHAEPIGLQIDHLQNWSPPCQRAIEQIVRRERREQTNCGLRIADLKSRWRLYEINGFGTNPIDP